MIITTVNSPGKKRDDILRMIFKRPHMKTMLITGASRGIGAATALLAARTGFSVIVNYNKNKLAAESVVNKIQF